MLNIAITAMILAGAAFMVYNIYGFAQFARAVKSQRSWKSSDAILYIPVGLLCFFLLGYVVVGLFGDPDLMMGGILFGGSIFVFIVYRILNSIIRQVLANEVLEAEIMAAEQSNRAKTKFLATVSHEMRTPMNVIIGQDRIALREPGITPDMRDHLEKIGLSAGHLMRLINNILELNRIEAGEMAIRQEEFSLRDDMEQVCAIADAMCEEKGLTFAASGAESLAPRYLGDGDVIKQVLLGLLDNAVKYTDAPGKVGFGISVDSAEGEMQRLTFSVRDTGIGMEPGFLAHAFDTFTQEDGSFTDRYGGSGLGLAVVKRIVDQMDGEITAESQKGVGSTFTVALFLKPLEEPEPVPEPDPAEVLESLEGCRILIVEDLPANAEIVEDLLELEGVETEHALNGQIGLDMMAASAPGYYDAILMDLRMPVMDGLEATRRIRRLNRRDARVIPIIALTANAAAEDVDNSLAAGMDVHLAKPADADMLYDTLKRYIRKERRQKEVTGYAEIEEDPTTPTGSGGR